ncbi:MAG: DUF2946 family protein [Dechloromonas sp.]|nr:MAG: DUF2946 family protein [Dechloromonas sp.]
MTVDLSAIAKWPNVPACHGWLSLDRRGTWRLQGERVTHRGLIEFINRQYGCDDSGCWFLQNGPQRVFVTLAYTPWVFRREAAAFVAHTGEPAGQIQAILIDEEGSILLASQLGIGLLDDRDLAHFLGECRNAQQQAVEERELCALMQGAPLGIYWQGLPLQPIKAADVAERYRFNPSP